MFETLSIHEPCVKLLDVFRFSAITEETLQQPDLPAPPGHCFCASQWFHRNDHIQTKVHGANLWSITIKGHIFDRWVYIYFTLTDFV